MNWKFWRREPKVFKPRIVFEMQEDGRISVAVDWPEGQSVEEKVSTAESIAQMVWYINDGQLMSICQQAVATSGHLKKDELFSEHVLRCLTWVIQRSGRKMNNDQDDVLVPPDEVFDR